MALDVSKLFEMLGDGWRELEITGDGRTPSTETPRLSLPSICHFRLLRCTPDGAHRSSDIDKHSRRLVLSMT